MSMPESKEAFDWLMVHPAAVVGKAFLSVLLSTMFILVLDFEVD